MAGGILLLMPSWAEEEKEDRKEYEVGHARGWTSRGEEGGEAQKATHENVLITSYRGGRKKKNRRECRIK